MRIASWLKMASLAVVFAAPLGSAALAGDHSGDQWRDDGDGRKVTTAYAQPAPALVRLEQRVYRADIAHQTHQAMSAEHVARLAQSDLG